MTIRFGIISGVHYHVHFWAEAIIDSPDAELVGIWDKDPVVGQAFAEKFNTRYWDDFDALLNACDAVGIAGETGNHVHWVERAASAGKSILLEKAMARNVAECDRIVRAVQDAGVVFMQNFPKRYDPINHELVQLVQSGELGAISAVRIRHCNDHLLRMLEPDSTEHRWFLDPELAGGGALIDEGVHAIDMMLWLLGDPVEVTASISNRTLDLEVEDTAFALFKFGTGTIAEIYASNMMLAAEESVEVYGTKGTAILSGVDLASKSLTRQPYLKIYRDGENKEAWQGPDTVPYFQHTTHFHQQGPLLFLECIKSGKQPVVNLADGRKSVILAEAAYQAARSGQAQKISY